MINLRKLQCNLSVIVRCYKFTLDPKDIEIKNVLGWGSGGAKVASQKNCAMVKHLPTNTIIKCHDTRSLERNISIAIARLTDKVELHLHGDESSVAIKAAKRIQSNKEKHEKAVEDIQRKTKFNKLKRLENETVRQKELERVLQMGLAYVPKQSILNASTDLVGADTKNVSLSEDEAGCEVSLSEYEAGCEVSLSEDEARCAVSSHPGDSPGKIYTDISNSEASSSLKSMFGKKLN